ncbi:MAG TPA: 50S ribosomal protein L3 [Thermoanaerobaculia bacterium]|nr:50S ribosomal protein L3 [Thermoanaerobaculia bacterium]
MDGILGRKLGMTQIFAEDGTALPVTLVAAGPCVVVQRKTTETDGYEAVQLGLLEDKPPKKISKPLKGHLDKAGVGPVRRFAEFDIGPDDAEARAGDQVKVSIFEPDQFVDVVGTSKGKGFQGVVRRHHFRGGRATHGSMFHRAPGSIGGSSEPSRVFPGMRAAGRMGGKRVTAKNVRVVKVDEDRGLLFLHGAVPGPRGGYVQIRRAKKG